MSEASAGCEERGCEIRMRSRSPQPPAPSPRAAASRLTEVLIAMGILTLGLLGVASVFPVGSFYMQKADDRRPAARPSPNR